MSMKNWVIFCVVLLVQVAVMAYVLGVGAEHFTYYLVVVVFTVLSYVDIKNRIVPDASHFVIVLLSVTNWDYVGIMDRLAGVFAVSLPIFGIAVLTKGFGGGDIKLFASLGFLFGWAFVVHVAFFAVVVSAVFAVGLIVMGKSRKTEIPFVPFIHVGFLVACLTDLGGMFLF